MRRLAGERADAHEPRLMRVHGRASLPTRAADASAARASRPALRVALCSRCRWTSASAALSPSAARSMSATR
eukprot:3200826-Prymnesium_polylepis.1